MVFKWLFYKKCKPFLYLNCLVFFPFYINAVPIYFCLAQGFRWCGPQLLTALEPPVADLLLDKQPVSLYRTSACSKSQICRVGMMLSELHKDSHSHFLCLEVSIIYLKYNSNIGFVLKKCNLVLNNKIIIIKMISISYSFPKIIICA